MKYIALIILLFLANKLTAQEDSIRTPDPIFEKQIVTKFWV